MRTCVTHEQISSLAMRSVEPGPAGEVGVHSTEAERPRFCDNFQLIDEHIQAKTTEWTVKEKYRPNRNVTRQPRRIAMNGRKSFEFQLLSEAPRHGYERRLNFNSNDGRTGKQPDQQTNPTDPKAHIDEHI